MQAELKSQLEEAAAKAGRSINSEIVARLEQTFSESTSSGATVPAITALAYRIATLEAHTLTQDIFLSELSKLGLEIVERFGQGYKPSAEELVEWRGFFSQFPTHPGNDRRRQEIDAMFTSLDQAKSRLRALATPNPTPAQAGGIPLELANAALKPMLDFLGSVETTSSDQSSAKSGASKPKRK